MTDAMSSLLDRAELDRGRVSKLLTRGLEGADDGELFLEYRQAEALVFDNGRLKQATYDTAQGFGLRAVKGEAVGYAHASDVSEQAISRAVEAVRAVQGGYSGSYSQAPARTNVRLYGDDNPLGAPVVRGEGEAAARRSTPSRARKTRACGRCRCRSARPGRWSRSCAPTARPIATSARWCASTSRWWRATATGRSPAATAMAGARAIERFIETGAWKGAVDDAVRQALVNLEAVPAPAGEFDVVLGPGWPGVMLHEAVGHGLEGDFNRKKTSAFAGLMGQQVAAKGVTVVDDGTMADRRGSLTIDDEGTPTSRTVLIEDGMLVGYMQDRQNARLMGMKPTGNGRRESYGHVPMPRMTNTYMLAGDRDPKEILASVKNGIYAVSFGGGQVDITSGKYVFQCTEAYKLENGKVGAPIKGAMLIGNGPSDLHRVSMIGNDLELDTGIGTCGKNGQGVPVGVGQPTLRMDRITVGGTG